MNIDFLSNRTKSFPDKPGIYQFLDASNAIIYIGKAKNLKKRVQSYFSQKSNINRKTKVLLDKTIDITYTVVESESEALLLENVFIKQYKPKYNILLKDDKTYPWINIKKETFPRVVITRSFLYNGSQYFGPFSSALIARTMLDLVKKLYPLRNCNYNLSTKNIQSGKLKPCLELHLGNCLGPCISGQTKDAYDENIKSISTILKGNIVEVLSWLRDKMKKTSGDLDFEGANIYKHKIEILEKYKSKTIITGIKSKDLEVYNYFEKNDFFVINLIKVVNGTIIQTYTLEVKRNLDEEITDILSSLILEIRKRIQSTTQNIVIPIDVEFKLNSINYIVPKGGEKMKLLKMSLKNCIICALEIEKRKLRETKVATTTILDVQKELNLSLPPKQIECFDNSNLQGTNPSSSCVVFIDAQPSKKDYRIFNVKTVTGIDDFATMQEVVYRRYNRILKEGKNLPQLILIDGGKGQLHAALASLKELGIENKIAICGIAKRNEELFFAEKNKSIVLDRKSQTLRLLQQIRDEAHRFGINHHRNRRSKNLSKSAFEKIPGIGIMTVRKLFVHYRDVNQLIRSDFEEVAKLIGQDKAQKIINFIKTKSD